MADDKWSQYAVTPTTDKWAKFAQYETPDPTKPDPGIPKPDPVSQTKEQAFVPGHGFGGGGQTVTGSPADVASLKSTQQGIAETGAASAATAGLGGVGGVLGMILRAASAGGAAGLTHAGTEAATTGKPDVTGSLKTGAEYAALEGGGELVGKGAGKVVEKLAPKVEPLAKINKLLGVGPSEVVPGKTPASLNEFAANPARGAMKAGLDEATLAKMGPLERNAAIMKAKDAAGKALDTQLQIATDQGKEVNLTPVMEKVFSGVEDAQAAKKIEDAIHKIFIDNKLFIGQVDQLTPVQAKAIQEALDALPEGRLPENTKELLVQGVRQAIKKSVPELGPLNQNYWDLSNASKGTQKLAREYATTVPENKLRKMVMKGILSGAGIAGAGALGYELFKPGKGPTAVP